MMYKKFLALALICGMLSGCATLMPGGDEKTGAERAMDLMDRYDALEQTYKSHYRLASDAEREWMLENIAPVLDDARAAIVVYAGTVATGDDASDEYIRVVALLRKAGMKIFEVENNGSK